MPSRKAPAAPRAAPPSPSPFPKPTPRPPKPRATAHIDLGPLKGAIAAQSAARRMTPSAWIRETLAARLATQDRAVLDTQAQPSAEPNADPTNDPTPDPTPDYQALFTRAEAAKLDAIVSSTGRRSRIAVLRALLDGVDLGTQGQAPSTTGATLFDATQALRSSNFALVPVGRNLNQVAKSLNAYPGKTSTAERMTIEQTVSAVSKHLDRAARLIAAVAPLVKSPNTKAAKATKVTKAAKPARTEQSTANGPTP